MLSQNNQLCSRYSKCALVVMFASVNNCTDPILFIHLQMIGHGKATASVSKKSWLRTGSLVMKLGCFLLAPMSWILPTCTTFNQVESILAQRPPSSIVDSIKRQVGLKNKCWSAGKPPVESLTNAVKNHLARALRLFWNATQKWLGKIYFLPQPMPRVPRVYFHLQS